MANFIGPWSNGYQCEFRDRGSIPSVFQITDPDLRQVGYKPQPNGDLLLD